LIVDDAPENIFILKEFLQPISSDIVSANNGQEALDKFVAEKFDIVFMDLQMPVMDGYAAVIEMRAYERKRENKKIPIYAITAHVSEFEKRKCLKLGFNDRLLKPIKKSFLIKTLTSHFDFETEDEIDKDIYNSDIIKKLMPRYIQARIEDIKIMKELVRENNFLELNKYGHKVKGSALSYGFKNINSLGKALEGFSEDENFKKCLDCIDGIERIISKEKAKLSH